MQIEDDDDDFSIFNMNNFDLDINFQNKNDFSNKSVNGNENGQNNTNNSINNYSYNQQTNNNINFYKNNLIKEKNELKKYENKTMNYNKFKTNTMKVICNIRNKNNNTFFYQSDKKIQKKNSNNNNNYNIKKKYSYNYSGSKKINKNNIQNNISINENNKLNNIYKIENNIKNNIIYKDENKIQNNNYKKEDNNQNNNNKKEENNQNNIYKNDDIIQNNIYKIENNNYENENNIEINNIFNKEEDPNEIIKEITSSYETATSGHISQEEKLKLLREIIEKEQEFLKTKNWQYKAMEQRLLIFIENLDKTQVLYTFKQLLQLKNEVDEITSEKTMENIIGILKNKDVINFSRPIVSVVVNLLHEIKGTEKYYKQLLDFLQENNYFFIEDESKLKFPLDLFIEYILDIDIFNLEVRVIGNEEVPKVIGKQLYNPPYGWTCYEFDIYSKYDNGDNSWMKMEGKEGEWAIAYHGVARNKSNSGIFSAIDNIIKNNLRQGVNQQYNLTDNANLDTIINYPKCGKGVYLTPKIQTAEVYAGILDINGKKYYTVLQFRVNPKYLRIVKDREDYWICEGSRNGVRPYRLLLKEKLINYKG